MLAETLGAAETDCLTKEESAANASEAAADAKDTLVELQRQQSALSEHLTSLVKQSDAAERKRERLLAKLGDAGDLARIEAGLRVGGWKAPSRTDREGNPGRSRDHATG